MFVIAGTFVRHAYSHRFALLRLLQMSPFGVRVEEIGFSDVGDGIPPSHFFVCTLVKITHFSKTA